MLSRIVDRLLPPTVRAFLPGAPKHADRPKRRLFNVARKRPAEQSSLFGGSNRFSARHGVSGRLRSGRCFSTTHESRPWWMVDLGAAWPIQDIRLHGPPARTAQYTASLQVSVSPDGTNWEVVYAGAHVFGAQGAPGPLKIHLHHRRGGRYVRLELQEPGILQLSQVEVMVQLRHRLLLATCKRYGFDFSAMTGLRPSRSKYHYWVKETGPAFDGTVDALHIRRRTGRFGNNIMQIANAMWLARHIGVSKVYVRPLRYLRFKEPVHADGVTLLPESALRSHRTGPVLSGEFFGRRALGDATQHFTWAALAREVQGGVRPVFQRHAAAPALALAETDLAIHIRSGDIFSRDRPHPSYTQPPLAFYQLCVDYARRNLGTTRVILVYEDEGNPCIGALKAWLQEAGMALVAHSSSLMEDTAILLAARHCVFGRGSFAPALLMLSERMRTVLYPWTESRILPIARACGIRPVMIADAAGEYIKVGEWRRSPEQLRMMVDYPIGNLQLMLDSQLPQEQAVAPGGSEAGPSWPSSL